MTVQELRNKISRILQDTLNKDLTEKIAMQVKDQVKTRTRKGFGVKDTGGRQDRLKPLKPVTKRIRKGLQGKGALSSETSPGKSNLTRKGDMLDTLEHKTNEREAQIFPARSQREKAIKVSEERPFMNLSKSEIDKVRKTIKDAILTDIKKKGL